jgi:integrase
MQKKLLLDGTDPGAKKKQDRLAAAAQARQTFGLIADEYLERKQTSGAATSTIVKTTWLLKDLAAELSDRPIHEISSAEILAILRSVEKSGRCETARRLRGSISRVVKMGIVTLRAEGHSWRLHIGDIEPAFRGMDQYLWYGTAHRSPSRSPDPSRSYFGEERRELSPG